MKDIANCTNLSKNIVTPGEHCGKIQQKNKK